jgi:hypothetical protein
MIITALRFRPPGPAKAEEPRSSGCAVADAREDDAIRALTERLKAAYATLRTENEVETAVAQAHAAFSDRPVRDFVPVLVERKARRLLDKASG